MIHGFAFHLFDSLALYVNIKLRVNLAILEVYPELNILGNSYFFGFIFLTGAIESIMLPSAEWQVGDQNPHNRQALKNQGESQGR